MQVNVTGSKTRKIDILIFNRNMDVLTLCKAKLELSGVLWEQFRV